MQNRAEIEKRKADITEVLSHHKIGIDSISANTGPTITLYEVVPEPGIKVSSIRNLEDDIALSLAAEGVRVIAPVPGKGCVGIEVPNEEPDIVRTTDIEENVDDKELPLLLGKTVEGGDLTMDLAEAPHLLMAGATGQGKSVAVNAMIKSLVEHKHPDELKFLMFDPKRVELSPYKDMNPYLIGNESVISDMERAVDVLGEVCQEMDHRYGLLEGQRVRNIQEYNGRVDDGLPYIVVIIDEFSDFIMNSGKEAEDKIVRITQLARAVGIHMIITTQRPSSDVITGLIKANVPARISFKLPTNNDSRTVLDEKGAENLIGKGDALLRTSTDKVRFQSVYVGLDDIDGLIRGTKDLIYKEYRLHSSMNNENNGTDPPEKEKSGFFNEGVANKVARTEDLSKLTIDLEERDLYYVIKIDDLWYVYYERDPYEHDANLLFSIKSGNGVEQSPKIS